MLPIATGTQSETSREPIHCDLNDLDSLIRELNTPKEVINNGAHTSPGAGINSPGENQIEGETPLEPIPAEIAALSGKIIAGTIDTALSTGFSIYAKAPTAEKYEATDKQIEKLNQAWQAVSQKYNYKIEDSPWFNVILLTVAVYFPIWKEAQKDHRFAEMDERLVSLQQQVKENEARLNLKADIKTA